MPNPLNPTHSSKVIQLDPIDPFDLELISLRIKNLTELIIEYENLSISSIISTLILQGYSKQEIMYAISAYIDSKVE